MLHARASLLLVLVAACANTDPPRDSPPAPTASESRAPEVVVDGAEVQVKVGTTVVRNLAGSSRGVAPEHRFTWSDVPTITGTAVKLLGIDEVPPPPDVDGGHSTFRYRFEAVAPGRSEVSIERVPAEPTPEPTATDAVRFVVVVTEG